MKIRIRELGIEVNAGQNEGQLGVSRVRVELKGTGLILNTTIPADETIEVDDVVEVTLVFDGNDANNEWFLMDVVFEEVL